jgi:outer membrane receptor protein involved in Fe transport
MEGVTDLDSFGAALKGSLPLPGSARLTAVTSFTDWRMDPYSSFLVIPPPLTNLVDQGQKRWNEELRLQSDPRGAVRAEAGAWLSRGTTDNFVLRAIPNLFPIEGSSFAEAERTAAVFGEATAEPLEGLSLTAGLRAEAGAKDFDRLEQVPVPGLAFDGSDRYGVLLPKLGADWRVGPNDSLEVAAAEGIRPGGFSSFTDNPALIPFAPERSTQYSAGWTRTDAGQSASLSVTAFYTAIGNLQIERSFSATDYFVANAPRAHSLGAEAQARWKPSAHWTIRLTAGWTRVLLDEFNAPLTGLNESGHEAPNAPAYNASLVVTLRPGGHWYAEGEATATGRTYFDELGTSMYTQDAYGLLALRWGYEAGPWSLLVFGENLANAGYYELIVPGVNSGMPGAPRTFGAKVAHRF